MKYFMNAIYMSYTNIQTKWIESKMKNDIFLLAVGKSSIAGQLFGK